MRCAYAYDARIGAKKLDEQWPGFLDVVSVALPEPELTTFLRNVRRNHSHYRLPLSSRLFPGLDPKLDDRLHREGHEKDLTLCRALAALPTSDQREFLELYLKDPADARRWAALPRWKRPLRKGDDDDQLIWAFFIMQRLNMEQAAREAPPWAMASQGAQLPQMFGAVNRLTLGGVKKLCLVMSTYGVMLQNANVIGDVVKKPWAT